MVMISVFSTANKDQESVMRSGCTCRAVVGRMQRDTLGGSSISPFFHVQIQNLDDACPHVVRTTSILCTSNRGPLDMNKVHVHKSITVTAHVPRAGELEARWLRSLGWRG
jgi:hypothetical protein